MKCKQGQRSRNAKIMYQGVWRTIPSSAYDRPRIPNICNHKAITYKNSCGGGRPGIPTMAGISFQKFWVGVSVSFSCRRIIPTFSLQIAEFLKAIASAESCNTNSWFGITEEFWVLDKIGEKVLLDELCCSSSTMSYRGGQKLIIAIQQGSRCQFPPPKVGVFWLRLEIVAVGQANITLVLEVACSNCLRLKLVVSWIIHLKYGVLVCTASYRQRRQTTQLSLHRHHLLWFHRSPPWKIFSQESLRSHSWTCRFHCQDEQKHLHETGLLLHINNFFFERMDINNSP